MPGGATDRYELMYGGETKPGSPDWPLDRHVVVTPSDGTPLPFVTRGIYVGGAGNIGLQFARDGSISTFFGVAAGTTLPFRCTHVRSTGTTATNIRALD